MLRLQQSQLTLTQRDIDDYKQRCEMQQIAHLMNLQYGSCSHGLHTTGHNEGPPKINRGPQRYRDDHIVHSTVSCAPSSAVECFVQSSSPLGASAAEISYSSQVKGQKPGALQRITTRRDSVLSNEESIACGGSLDREDSGPGTPGNSWNVDLPPRSLAGSSQQPTNCPLRRWTGMPKRCRPRSLTDPNETALPDLQLRRTRGRGSMAGKRRVSRESARLDDSDSAAENSLPPVPEHRDTTSLELYRHALDREPSPGRARHHSLPANLGMSISLLQDLQNSQAGRWVSCGWNALPPETSPLDVLEEQIAALSVTDWVADQGRPSNSYFDTTQSDANLEAAPTSPIHAGEDFSYVSGSSDTTLNLQSPKPSPDTVNSERGERRGESQDSRPSSSIYTRSQQALRKPGNGLPPELAVARGGRPRVGSLIQDSQRPAHRRNQLNPEQENEENMQRFEREREIRAARNAPVPGGVVESTPPPEGQLERLLG